MNAILAEADGRMQKSVDLLRREFGSIRAGRATPALLERVMVDYYGSPTPVNQLAQISVPEPRTLVVQPWDKSALADLEKAILKSDLGIMPTNDGQVIRLAMPQLTEERRKDLVKVVHKKAEDERVAIRNIRREAMEKVHRQKKDGTLPEDEASRLEVDIQKLTDQRIKEIDGAVALKEKEILEV